MSETPEPVGRAIERLSLPTPTLPPATETNSYLVGPATGGFFLVEPAPPGEPSRAALRRAIDDRVARGGRLLGLVLTHHHVDHVGAASELRARYGVPVLAHPRTRDKLAGRVPVDMVLDEGDEHFAALGIDVLHTPGHAPGHLCFFHREDRWLVAGDMVASVGTIVIDPDDDGDMAEYVAQLRRLAALGPRRLLPAHGEPIDDAVPRLEFYVRHRLEREGKVLDALSTREARELARIVPAAYSDTPVWLYPLAMKSARAHLDKLASEGRARREGEGWRRT